MNRGRVVRGQFGRRHWNVNDTSLSSFHDGSMISVTVQCRPLEIQTSRVFQTQQSQGSVRQAHNMRPREIGVGRPRHVKFIQSNLHSALQNDRNLSFVFSLEREI